MIRFVLLAMLAFLLTACQVVFIPVPIDMQRAKTVVTEVAKTPDTDAFKIAYDAMGEQWHVIRTQLDAPNWQDEEWCKSTEAAAHDWRKTIDTLRDMPQPEGDRWDEAWPVFQSGMDKMAEAAGSIETAAQLKSSVLMKSAPDLIISGVNLAAEAMRILGGD